VATFSGCNEGPPTLLKSAGSKSDAAPVDPSRRFEQTMSVDGRVHVSMRHKPDNLTLLDSDPPKIELELLRGRWLIIVYSTLNSHDVAIAAASGELASKLIGVRKVAIRPTRDFKESRTWIPGYEQTQDIEEMEGIVMPLWLLMDDGAIMRWHRGG